MILVVTCSDDPTADFLLERCDEVGLDWMRMNTDCLLSQWECRVAVSQDGDSARAFFQGVEIAAEDVATVWFRRPQPPGPISRKSDFASQSFLRSECRAGWNSFLSAIPEPCWINHPLSIAKASLKIDQLRRARELGFQIPSTLVSQSPSEARGFAKSLDDRVIVKPLEHGSVQDQDGNKLGAIYTTTLLPGDLDSMQSVENCPTLFQEHIGKIADIRVTIVDGCIESTRLMCPKDAPIDVRWDNMRDVAHEPIATPDHISSRVAAMTKSYGLRFAALDFGQLESGEWVFFELNPNGQWAWIEQRCGQDVSGLFLTAFHGDRRKLEKKV